MISTLTRTLAVVFLLFLMGCPPKGDDESTPEADGVAITWEPGPIDSERAAPWSDLWAVERVWAEQVMEIQVPGRGTRKLRGALAWVRPHHMRMKLVTGMGFGVFDLAVGPGGWIIDVPTSGVRERGLPGERPSVGEDAPFPADLLASFLTGPTADWGGAVIDGQTYGVGPLQGDGPAFILQEHQPGLAAVAIGLHEGREVLRIEGDDFEGAGQGAFPWHLVLIDSRSGAVIDVRAESVRTGDEVPKALFLPELEHP